MDLNHIALFLDRKAPSTKHTVRLIFFMVAMVGGGGLKNRYLTLLCIQVMISWAYVLFRFMFFIMFLMLMLLLSNECDIETLCNCLGGNLNLQRGEKLIEIISWENFCRNWNSPGKLDFLPGCVVIFKGTRCESDHCHVLSLSSLNYRLKTTLLKNV